MAGKQETLIYIEQENKTEAEFMSKSFVTGSIKNRAYINALGAELITKYLSSEGVNVNDIHNLHSISKILEKIDISDIQLPNIHIDVRVIFDENQIFIPKSHFELNLVPDIYAVLKLSKDFTYVEFLGYFAPKLINKKNQNSEYYFIEKEKLSTPQTFTKFVKDFAGMTSRSISQDDMLRGRELSISMADHNITDEEQKELLNLLLHSDELRDSVLEFDNFETLSYSVGSSMEPQVIDNVIEADVVNSEDENNSGEEMLETSEETPIEDETKEVIEDTTGETAEEETVEPVEEDSEQEEVQKEEPQIEEEISNDEIELPTNDTEDMILDESFFNMEDDEESTVEQEEPVEETKSETVENDVEDVGVQPLEPEEKELPKEEPTPELDASDYLLSLEEDDEPTKPKDEEPKTEEKSENTLEDTISSAVKKTMEKTVEATATAGTIAAASQTASTVETASNVMAASKDAIKLAGISGDIVKDLINKNLENQQQHLDRIDYAKNKTNTADVPENIAAYDLSTAKMEANIEAEQSGQFDSPTELDSLQKVNTTPKGYNENIEQEVIDLGQMDSVELDHVEENTEGIVDLNNLSQVESPTKPVQNLEEKLSECEEDKGMDLPDLTSFTINDDGTSSIDNLDINFSNEKPHEENLIDFNMNTGNFVIDNNDVSADGNNLSTSAENELTLDDDFADDLMSDDSDSQSQENSTPNEDENKKDEDIENIEPLEEPTLDDSSLPDLDVGDDLTLDDNLTLDNDIASVEPTLEENLTPVENSVGEEPAGEPIIEENITSDVEDLTIDEVSPNEDETLTLDDDFNFEDTTEAAAQQTEQTEQTEDMISEPESQTEENSDVTDLDSVLNELEESSPVEETPIKDDINEIQEDFPALETPIDEELQTIEEVENTEENNAQNQDWLEEPNYDDLQDVEPIQQNDDEIISETPQQEDVESLTPIEELSDEEFIQEPQSEEKSFNVVENSTVISDMDFAPREIEIDINNPEIQLQPEGPAQLEDLYDENSENSTMLQNPGRLTRGNQQGGKVGLGMGLGIVGVLISIIIVGIIGFSISKMVKKPSDEAPEPITDDAVPTSSDNGVSEANTLNVDQSNVVNMDNTNPIATPVKKQQQAALPKTVAQTPTQSKNSIPATSYIDVRKVSWEVPDYVSYNANFRQYFQSAGKSLKLSLTSDLLLATDYAYSDQVRVSILFDKDGTFKDSKILLSSGSAQIDNIVLQTVNQTLRVLKAPHSIGNDESTTVILKIYF